MQVRERFVVASKNERISMVVYISREACGVPGRGAWPPSIGGGRAAAGGTPAGGGMDLTWDLRPSGPGTRNCIIIYLMPADLGPFAGCKQTWDLGSPTQHLAQSSGWKNTVHGPGTPNTKRKQLSGCHSQARALFRSDGVALASRRIMRGPTITLV